MYDSLSLWIEGAGLELAPLLSRLAEHQRGQSYYITGDLGNLNLVLSVQGVSIKGSLAKWYLGDNLQTLTRGDTQRAIESLSDTLSLNVAEAKVKRADVATNFLMQHSPTVYYPYLGDCQHYQRTQRQTSLYYEANNRTKLFYDKSLECKAKGVPLHEVFEGQNVLRFELRFMHRLGKEFNTASLTAQHLYDEGFYMGMIDKWVNEYKSITKLKKMAFKDQAQLKPKDFLDQILLQAVVTIGQSEVLEMVEEARKRGQFERPEYASRTKAMIKELCTMPQLTEPSELIQELDQKVKAVQRYYR
jgi:hypothetical protein